MKACPFCGGAGKLFSHAMTKDKTLWWVQCGNSHCLARRLVTDDKAAAIAAWNEREEQNHE